MQMVSEEQPLAERLKLHYVDTDASDRARFAQIAMQLGHHCELYCGLAEIAVHPPRFGILVLRDEPATGAGVFNAIARLEQMGIWLSVLAIGEAPEPRTIVEAIKAGALDYLTLPLELSRLQRCLARISVEDQHTSIVRRRRAEAQERINRLTAREGEVLDQLAFGQSNKSIARKLGISPRTVEIHRANMMSKLEASSAAGVVRIALDAGRVHA
jgi:FixJ family two-component response regulator